MKRPRTTPDRPLSAAGQLVRAGIPAAVALLAATMLTNPARAATGDCQSLASDSVANAQITTAQTIAAGSFTPPGSSTPITLSVPVCRVVATVSTRPSEQVGIEVWLPASDWNGRFEGLGSGGFGGSINYTALAAAAARGFATANTGTGHVGGSSGAIGQTLPWVQNPVTLRDWGHTSIHLMTRAAQAIIQDFYGQASAFSYYEGCSTGGAEAMEEAEFYPKDYDGIHAGSPGMDYSHLMESFLWGALLPAKDPAATLNAAALTLLNNTVLQQCGGAQAVQARYLLDPRDCHYDPAQLLCQAGQDPSTCLTADQVSETKRLYSPVTDPRTGLDLYPGFARGSESQWSLIQGALVPSFAQPLLANAVFNNPNWDWTTFDFDRDAALVDRVLSPVINATSPDLRAFAAHGGKLLMTQGWADALNAQTLPIEYFNSVLALQGSLERTQAFFRLFMAPGMSHCGGGPGPNTIGGSAPPTSPTPERDVVAALEAWVENGQAPASLISTKYVNDTPPAVARELTLCPYPQLARFAGGDPTQAASYRCTPDDDDFAKDLADEVSHIATDLRIGDPANLPN